MIKKFAKKLWRSATAPLRKILSWIYPAPDMPDIQGVMVEKQGSDHALPLVYGTRRIGGIKVHKYVTDAPGGAENEFLHLIVALCEGPVHSIEEVFFNGISENDAQWNKDGGGKWFTISRHLGAHDQPASAAAVSGIPNWTSNHRLQGVAYLYIRLQMDEQQSIWRGEPEIVARVAGRTIHDPRTGQTGYSENPALQLLDYLQDPVYGKGMPAGRLNIASFIAAANLCDQTVDNTAIINGIATGRIAKRFTGNQVIDTSRSVFANVQQMLQVMRGMLPIGTGQIRLQLEGEGEPVFFFSHERSDALNHATIVGPIKSSSGKKNGRFNRVIVRFANKDADYEQDEVFWPANDHPLAQQWLDEDNGVRLEQSFEFPGITNKAEALQMAEILAKRSRNQLSCSFSASPLAILCEPGDIVGITDDTRGWDAKPFRVEETKHNEDGSVDLDFIEHQNAVYPWSGTTYDERIGGTNLGDPTNILAPTGLTLTPDDTLQTGGRLTWSTSANAFVRRYQVNVFAGAALLFSEETVARAISLPLLDVGEYTITVRAISSLGTYSPAATLAFNLSVPMQPIDVIFEVSNFEIYAKPVLAGIGLGTSFEFFIVEGDGVDAVPEAMGRGTSLVFVNRRSNTLHTVFVRTVNVLGVSAWVSYQVTTTQDSFEIIELIREKMKESVFDPVVDELREELTNRINVIEEDIDDPRVDLVQHIEHFLNYDENKATIESVSYALNTEVFTRVQQFNQLSLNDQVFSQNLQAVEVKADGSQQAINAMRTAIEGDDTETSAELILQSWKNDIGELNSRVFLGVQEIIEGRAISTGLVIDGETRSFEVRADVFQWSNSKGQRRLYWDNDLDTLVIRARVVLDDGFVVNDEDDIRGLDGIYTEFRYRRSATKPVRPTAVNPSETAWSFVIPEGTLPVWVIQVRKVSGGGAFAAGDSWSEPERITGETGEPGIYTEFRFRRSASEPVRPTVVNPSETAWPFTVPEGTLPVWVIEARKLSGGGAFAEGDTWSVPARLSGEQGTPGASGAGFYGSTYSSITWTTSTANSRFNSLVGRAPVQHDVFVQTRTDGTDSQARQYTGSAWVAATLQVNGNIVAKGSIAGDRFIAGTEISAPVLRSAKIEQIGTSFMELSEPNAFGPDNLVQWYGPRINGVTWNNNTQQVIYSGIRKNNAKQYKGADGSVFFGGTFIAGTISSAESTGQLINTPSIEVIFSSIGGVIEVAASYSYQRTFNWVDGNGNPNATCPSTLPTAPSGTVYLERWTGSSWQIVAQQSISGSVSCAPGIPGGGGEPTLAARISVSAGRSITYTDSFQTSANRRYRARAVVSNAIYNISDTTQFVSVASSE